MWQKALSVGGGGDTTLYRHKVENVSGASGSYVITINNVIGNVKALLFDVNTTRSILGFIDDAGILYKDTSANWVYYADSSNFPKLTQTGTSISMGKGTGGAVTGTCYYWSDEP